MLGTTTRRRVLLVAFAVDGNRARVVAQAGGGAAVEPGARQEIAGGRRADAPRPRGRPRDDAEGGARGQGPARRRQLRANLARAMTTVREAGDVEERIRQLEERAGVAGSRTA